MTSTSPWRKIVGEQLDMLNSVIEQREYEAKVPKVDVTAELVTGWFDDSYHQADPEFRSCFTAAELVALAEFHRKYEAALPLLPPTLGTIGTWLACPTWQALMESARYTRGQLAG